MATNTQTSYLQKFAEATSAEWPQVLASYRRAESKLKQLDSLVADLTDSDTSVVVFGSLGRKEWTSGSDVDWTLLIDGQADPEHAKTAQEIAKRLKEAKLEPPGRSGVFGSTAFGHDIVHRIGGQADSNRNITQRILLLIESSSAGRHDAYRRVTRQVISRYLANGLGDASEPDKVPRFLLNDIVRYWRTMAVDFAFKKWDRASKGWGLRNIKLRFSRKLILLGRLLSCFACEPTLRERLGYDSVRTRLEEAIRITPLELLAECALQLEETRPCIRKIIDTYEEFLAALDHEKTRNHLKDLAEEVKGEDETFQSLRKLGHEFQKYLSELVFDCEAFSELTRKYGIF